MPSKGGQNAPQRPKRKSKRKKPKGKVKPRSENVQANETYLTGASKHGRKGVTMGMAARNTEKQHAYRTAGMGYEPVSRLGPMNFIKADLPYTATLHATLMPAKIDSVHDQAQSSDTSAEKHSPSFDYKPMWEMEAESAFERLQMTPAPNVVRTPSQPITSRSSYNNLSTLSTNIEPPNHTEEQDKESPDSETLNTVEDIQNDKSTSNEAPSKTPDEIIQSPTFKHVSDTAYSGSAQDVKLPFEEDTAVIDTIVRHRIIDGILQYRVQFEGNGFQETSWVDANDLDGVNYAVANNLNSRFDDVESSSSVSSQNSNPETDEFAKILGQRNELDGSDVDLRELDAILDAQEHWGESFDESDLEDDILDSERFQDDFLPYDGNTFDSDSFDDAQVLHGGLLPKTASKALAKKAKKQMAKARSLGLADNELQYAMGCSFIRDREKMKLTKQERAEYKKAQRRVETSAVDVDKLINDVSEFIINATRHRYQEFLKPS